MWHDGFQVEPPNNLTPLAKSFSNDHQNDPTAMPISGIAFVSARDLSRWADCLHHGRILSAGALVALGHSYKPSKGGLGHVVFRDSVMVFHHHDRQSRNFDAWLDADLATETTIVLLSNNRQHKLGEVTAAIAAILRGQPYRQSKKSLALYLDHQADSLPIAAFIALYQRLLRTRSDVFEFQDEDDLNSFGYRLMNGNRLDDAIQLFKLNVERFPASQNGYGSLGEALMAQGVPWQRGVLRALVDAGSHQRQRARRAREDSRRAAPAMSGVAPLSVQPPTPTRSAS